jgi:hypothetical protein
MPLVQRTANSTYIFAGAVRGKVGTVRSKVGTVGIPTSVRCVPRQAGSQTDGCRMRALLLAMYPQSPSLSTYVSVVTNASRPESTLSKKHNSIACRRVRECRQRACCARPLRLPHLLPLVGRMTVAMVQQTIQQSNTLLVSEQISMSISHMAIPLTTNLSGHSTRLLGYKSIYKALAIKLILHSLK